MKKIFHFPFSIFHFSSLRGTETIVTKPRTVWYRTKQSFMIDCRNEKSAGQKGFTLIELLIYSGLMSILLAVFATLFGMIIDAKLESDSSSGVQQDGQYILSKLAKDIRSAQSITTPASIGQTTASLQLTIGSTAYTYSTDANGNLIVTANSASDVLNSYRTAISNVQFTRMGGNVSGKNSVTFSFTIKSNTIENTGQETETFTSTESTR